MLEIKDNANYSAIIFKLKEVYPLNNMDNLVGVNVYGNQVLISNKNLEIGSLYVYFPVETELANDYVVYNNLYEDKELNNDKTLKGFINNKRRVRCIKLRGNKSEGLLMPISSLDIYNYTSEFKEGDTFDHIDGQEVCKKYIRIVEKKQTSLKKIKKIVKFQYLIPGIFKFHKDTKQLGYNIDKLKETDIIHISDKWHGTSAISSYLICYKQLKWYEKIAQWFKCAIKDKEYKYICSSRTVIKDEINNNLGYYNENIWNVTHNYLKSHLSKGMTIYYEIVGYLKSGKMIQKDYDYNCKPGEHKIAIYRITITNEDGETFEFSPKQIQDWCVHHNLLAVKELYYGTVIDLYKKLTKGNESLSKEYDKDVFLKLLIQEYCDNRKNIECANKVPVEGIVIRVDNYNEIDLYKLKGFDFKNYESKCKDNNEEDIEETESVNKEENI